MFKTLGIALGAGIASALLFIISTMPSLAVMALAYLTPLPVMIAALGFGQLSGGAAALVGGTTVAFAVSPLAGIVFLAVLALPAWYLSYLALLARPANPSSPPRPAGEAVHWYPLADLVVWMGVLAAGPVLVLGGVVLLRYGGYDAAIGALAARLGAALDGMPLPVSFAPEDLIRAAPVAMAASMFLMLAVNLWIGGRVVLVSQRLSRPWPRFADELRLPPPVTGVMAVALAATFLPEPLGLAASVVGATLGMAFILEGLATVHVMTRGLSGRRMILVTFYLIIVVLKPWPLLALALLGCLDCLTPLRRYGPTVPTNRRS